MLSTMVDGISTGNGLESDVRELENRMYQIEDVLRTLQQEIGEMKRRSSKTELMTYRPEPDGVGDTLVGTETSYRSS